MPDSHPAIAPWWLRSRLEWIEREAELCEQIGAARLAAWWRNEYLRVMATT